MEKIHAIPSFVNAKCMNLCVYVSRANRNLFQITQKCFRQLEQWNPGQNVFVMISEMKNKTIDQRPGEEIMFAEST